MERYLLVQQEMRASLESDYRRLQARIEAIDSGQRPSPRQLLAAYRDIAELIVASKRAQVQALNQHDFSLSEYGWVRSRTLEALGMASYATFDLQELIGSVTEGEVPVETTAPTVPSENVELVSRYRDRLDEVIGFALVGL